MTLVVWGIYAVVPFFWSVLGLATYSLSDVPTAYLIWIPGIAIAWMVWRVKSGMETEGHGLPRGRLAAGLGVAGVVLLIGFTIVPSSRISGLLLWPGWMALLLWAFFGRGSVRRCIWPLCYLLLAWPPIVLTLIRLVTPGLEGISWAVLLGLANHVHWVHAISRHPMVFLLEAGGRWTRVNITTACSGTDSVLALWILFPVALSVFPSTVWRKAIVLAAGSLLAVVANNLRILAILVSARHFGIFFGFQVVHVVLGPLLFVLVVAGGIRFGSRSISTKPFS